MPLPNISPELLKAYQEEIAKRTSPATAKRKASSLRRFFNWAHKEGHIDENPLVQPSGSTITQLPEKPKPSFFRFSNILRFAGLAGLVVLIFLLAKRVQISIPWRLAPATEEELAQQVPQPTPILPLVWPCVGLRGVSRPSVHARRDRSRSGSTARR